MQAASWVDTRMDAEVSDAPVLFCKFCGEGLVNTMGPPQFHPWKLMGKQCEYAGLKYNAERITPNAS